MKRTLEHIFAICAGAALGVSCAPNRRGGDVGTVASDLTVSSSKLGPHINNRGDDPHAERVLGACPRVAKWVLAGAQIQAEIARYRQNCTGAVVILRVWSPQRFSTGQDPSWAADQFWGFMAGRLNGFNRGLVDWLEGPNEGELFNWPEDWNRQVGVANWYGRFWSRLADQIHNNGYNPMLGSISVGNPALSGESGFPAGGAFRPLADVMRSKPYRIGWSYHAYSNTGRRPGVAPMYDAGDAYWGLLRYRIIRDQNGVGGYPLALTEAGLDGRWAPGYDDGRNHGWRDRGISANEYMDWLRWFDTQIQQDSQVMGATLFTYGDTGIWTSYELGAIDDLLSGYLGAGGGGRYAPVPFQSLSTQRSGYGDWDFCHQKGDCARGETINGVSVNPWPKYGRAGLCRAGNGFGGGYVARLTVDNRVDQRRASRLGDWAWGYLKLECGAGEYVAGLSENATQCQGNSRFHGIVCAAGSRLGNSCYVRVGDVTDSRATTVSGDWDPGAFKAECGASEYVAGVSVDFWGTGAPHSILCCSAAGAGPLSETSNSLEPLMCHIDPDACDADPSACLPPPECQDPTDDQDAPVDPDSAQPSPLDDETITPP